MSLQILETIRWLKSQRITNNDISKSEWLIHFKSLFSNDSIYDSHIDDCVETEHVNIIDATDDAILDSEITEKDVVEAISHLPKGKSAGPDQIVIEMFKCAVTDIMPFLLKCFNRLYDQGIFPNSWARSIIVPLYKKGDRNNPDNYRGISLMSILGKVYTTILNKRLTKWADLHDKIPETQAGFRSKYSTVDHIFTLYAIIQKCLSRRKHKLYVAFVDIKRPLIQLIV